MSTREEMPISSIVRRSASRICAEFKTRIQDTKDIPYGTLSFMAATVNVNGRIFDQEHASISVFDHGFLYGEGVYETLRTYNGQPFLFDRHMRRLRKSADMLALPVPLSNEDIDARVGETVGAAGLGDVANREGYIRIPVPRGIGELAYEPAAWPSPSL